MREDIGNNITMEGAARTKNADAGAGVNVPDPEQGGLGRVAGFEDVEGSGGDVMLYLQNLREAYGGTLPENVEKATKLAEKAHRGQTRKSGEPYITHPVAVGVELIKNGWDPETVAAGICHDVVEDCGVTTEELAELLGQQTASLVDGVTRVGQVRGRDLDEIHAVNLAKLVGFIAGDVRVLAVKLADRLHNMRTLEYLLDDKRQRIARETLEIYAPLAKRIGAEQWAGELEDLGFRWGMPEEWGELEKDLERLAYNQQQLELQATKAAVEALRKGDITASVSSRAKGRWSLWQKLQKTGRDILEVSDLVGLRVIVGSEMDCYGALGTLHKTFTPVPQRFKDYIAIPKTNGYQSLHTTVVDEQGRRFEIQIRTSQMHNQALWGNAAHHAYKIGEPLIGADPALSAEQFLEELKTELSQQQEILVLTPKGRVINLPVGACGIDFAYAVHTEVGHSCVGVKVNGALRPIRAPLHTGDVVEVITRKEASPKRDWLENVTTAAARNRIRRYFAQQDRSINEARGKEAVETMIRERRIPGEPTDKEAQKLGCGTKTDLYIKLGEGSMSVSRLASLYEGAPKRKIPTKMREPAKTWVPELEGLRFQLAQCCRPVDGDEMVGYVTVGRGVSVHRAECLNVQNLQKSLREEEAGRILKIATRRGWEITVKASDRPGLLADVSAVFADSGVDITSSATVTKRQKVTETFYCANADAGSVDALVGKLRDVPSVVAVTHRRL